MEKIPNCSRGQECSSLPGPGWEALALGQAARMCLGAASASSRAGCRRAQGALPEDEQCRERVAAGGLLLGINSCCCYWGSAAAGDLLLVRISHCHKVPQLVLKNSSWGSPAGDLLLLLGISHCHKLSQLAPKNSSWASPLAEDLLLLGVSSCSWDSLTNSHSWPPKTLPAVLFLLGISCWESPALGDLLLLGFSS